MSVNQTKASGRGRRLTELRRSNAAGTHRKARVRSRERRNAIAQSRREG